MLISQKLRPALIHSVFFRLVAGLSLSFGDEVEVASTFDCMHVLNPFVPCKGWISDTHATAMDDCHMDIFGVYKLPEISISRVGG